jgi:hypothetical protein
VLKSHKYFRNLFLNFLVKAINFRAYFRQKNFPDGICPKIYLGQDPDPEPDPDPDVFESGIRIRIRSKIVRIRNTGDNKP